MTERPRVLKTSTDTRARPGRAAHGLLYAMLALACVFATLQVWWAATPAAGVAQAPRVVEIPPHQGLLDIAHRLDGAGVIRSPFGFALLALARGSARSLKAGEYEVPQGSNTFAVLSLLEGGKVLKHTVVLREGFTLADLAQNIEAEGLASAADVVRGGHDPLFLRTLEIPASSVEGYLFPDSYQFVKGESPEEMLARMVARMRGQLTPDILKAASERGLNTHQLLTLASIIEREGIDPSELPLISAVFWNRLKRDMPLQADPTVQYAVGKGRQTLTHDDLQVDNPFNTYRRAGLPPGPIGNPGLPSIKAAANPAPVNYLYFVSMGDDRRHRFSQTLADHNDAVARYRLAKPR
jgi:UPF0755 protein